MFNINVLNSYDDDHILWFFCDIEIDVVALLSNIFESFVDKIHIDVIIDIDITYMKLIFLEFAK